MKIRIIAIGSKHDADLKTKIEDYQKRLNVKVDWLLLPHSITDGDKARRAESAQILKKLSSKDFIVLLDERGTELSSEGLASKYSAWLEANRSLIFIIGGAYGVDEAFRNRADFSWSLSKLVFPHQIVRLLLVEQLYRAQSIAANHPYHHS